MSYYAIFLLALALAMDAFAVSVGSGCQIKKPDLGHYFRLSFAFGFFQFIMPVFGWLLGSTVRDFISSYDHWVAFLLLAFIGAKMVKESFDREENCKTSDPTRGFLLITLAVATSIDALAVGLSFALIKMSVIVPSLIIGFVCAFISAFGLYLGSVLSSAQVFGRRAELVGGLVLIGIGIKILMEHNVF